MSEYMERHTVSRLIGAPPGYVGFDQGGLLTDGVDQHPHCVLLLDEIEKAHPDLFNVLLQVMDHGKLTDHNGKQVDFRNVILIMTTNAGASDMAKAAYGFTRTKREGDDIEAINRLFAPEFRNRLDAIITFAHLSQEVIAKVVEKFVLQLEAQLGDRNVTIELSEEATPLADRQRLRRADGRAADGARDPGAHQEAARRRGAVRQAQGRRSRARHRRQGRERPRQARLRIPRRPGDAEAGEAAGGARRRPSAARRGRGRRATAASAARCRRCRWSRSRCRSQRYQKAGPCARPLHFARCAHARRPGCARVAAMGQVADAPCRARAPSIVNRRLLRAACDSALTSVFFLVLAGTYIGIGALAHDFGLSRVVAGAVDRPGLGGAGAGDPDLRARRRARR